MDLPKVFQRRLKEAEDLPERERDQVLSALFATKWNRSEAARKLSWSRMTLYRKMMKYDIVEQRTSGEAVRETNERKNDHIRKKTGF